MGALSYERYRTGEGEEYMMRIGPAEGAPVLFLPPLFEEMNRTRAFLASIMRALAARGFGCWLPDLPGTGESELLLLGREWGSWREAAADAGAHLLGASGREPLTTSFRGGALLDDGFPACGMWRFAPAEGASLARDLVRASMLAPDELKARQLDLAGYTLSQDFLAALRDARVAPMSNLRTVRLQSDRQDADMKLDGPALWRRSEPGTAPQLSALIASDIEQWYARCGG